MITKNEMDGGWYLYRPEKTATDCRPEWNEQVDFVAWVREFWPDDARLALHPANEGLCSAQYRQKLLKAGLLPGASDLIFLLGGLIWPCAVIEMKREWHKSKPSTVQIDFLCDAAKSGKFAAVCNGASAAKDAFLDYKLGFDRAK
jgi:hypothetical protein